VAKEQQKTTPDAGAAAGKPAAATKRKKEFKKKRERRVIPHGLVHIAASFNNTQIAITDTDGRTVCWSSSGAIGFKQQARIVLRLFRFNGGHGQLMNALIAQIIFRHHRLGGRQLAFGLCEPPFVFRVVEQHSGVAQTNPIIQSIAFPQPSKDHTTISGIKTKEAHLYDIEGIEHPVCFKQQNDGTEFSWEDVPKGLYYLSIKDIDWQLHRAKIMVSP